MSIIKIADLNHNASETRLLNDREIAKTVGGFTADYSNSSYDFDGFGGDQKVAIVTQNLYNRNEQFAIVGSYFGGDLNSNSNFQSNSATAD